MAITRNDSNFLRIVTDNKILSLDDGNEILSWQKRLYETFLNSEDKKSDVKLSAMLLPRVKSDEQITKRVIHLYTHQILLS